MRYFLAGILAAIAIISIIIYIIYKRITRLVQFVTDDDIEEIYTGQGFLSYEESEESKYIIDLSRYDENNIIGIKVFGPRERNLQSFSQVLINRGYEIEDIEDIFDDFCEGFDIGETNVYKLKNGEMLWD